MKYATSVPFQLYYGETDAVEATVRGEWDRAKSSLDTFEFAILRTPAPNVWAVIPEYTRGTWTPTFESLGFKLERMFTATRLKPTKLRLVTSGADNEAQS